MTSKKFILLAGLICLIASSGIAQVSTAHPYTAPHPLYGTYSVTDQAYYPKKSLAQYNDFLVGKRDFPVKPKDMWEVGVKAGMFTIFGDIASWNKPFKTGGFGVHVRKSLGHVISLRAEYLYGVAWGKNWKPSTGYIYAPMSNPYRKYYNGQKVYYNYRAVVQDFGLQLVGNVHNIRFYKDQTSLTLYGLAGLGLTFWKTAHDALFGTVPMDFSKVSNYNGEYAKRKDVLDQLNKIWSESIESPAETDPGVPYSKMFASSYKPSGTIGAGVAFRINSRINIALEDRHTFVKTDLLDGMRWSEQGSLTRDFDSYNYLTLGLNFNLGSKAKRVEPLYWLNPLNYAYSELRRVPEIILPDADGDGVTDQFDQEQTPAGCPVDTHGVSRDTDGDGVPDCKDKELVTPTYCQPVDADGVGKCPCPEGCAAAVPECTTLLGALPSVAFKANSNKLSDDATAVLATVASRLRANPTCKVVVVGYCAANKRQQQLSWDHVNKVITYLVEKEGVSSDRFIFSSGQEGGDCNVVDLRAAAPGEDGPNTVAPPHPNLRKN